MKKFYCDNCNEIIDDISQGYVEYKMVDKHFSDFRIVHLKECFDSNCSQEHLKNFYNENETMCISKILTYLNNDYPFKKNPCLRQPKDMVNFVDFVKRLSVKHYEEARRYFEDPVCQEYMTEQDPESVDYAQVVNIAKQTNSVIHE